jgi:hypothetical protein
MFSTPNRIALAIVAVASVGCYQPSPIASCLLRCEVATSSVVCPSGLTCASGGFCVASGETCSDAGVSDGAPADDAPTDDGGDGRFCFGVAPNTVCFAAQPTGAITLVGFDTGVCSLGELRSVNGRQTCVVAGAVINVQARALITGLNPVFLIGIDNITINAGGGIDASSSALGVRRGAGSQPFGICPTPNQGGDFHDGSAGGSYAGRGGNGGLAAVEGGPSADVLEPGYHGGCDGAPNLFDATTGGPGGGAVYLATGPSGSITIGGFISAAGGGGLGGASSFGGAGGGSGGYIALDTPALIFGAAGKLIATGGGGGGGANSTDVGQPGGDPTAANGLGQGGAGASSAGEGGNGGVQGNGIKGGDPTGGDLTLGAGGGGGGTGRIEFYKNQQCATRCEPIAALFSD